jgi:hypothetical protein
MTDSNTFTFVPDEITMRENCYDRVETLVKYAGNPVLTANKDWEGKATDWTCAAWPCVVYSKRDRIFKMWYMAITKEDVDNNHGSKIIDNFSITTERSYICYAYSEDGVNWEKPELDIMKKEQYPGNNIVACDSGFFLGCASVIEDENEKDPSRTYKMMLYDNDGKGNDGIRTLVSPDGFNWQDTGGFPVLPSQDTPSLWYDPSEKKYMAFLKERINNRRARMISESTDFKHWTEPRVLLAPDISDVPTLNLYGQSAFRQGGHNFGFLDMYDLSDQKAYTELISGTSAVGWRRLPTKPNVLGHGFDGAWDSGGVYMGLGEPVEVDGKCYCYYSGSSVRHDDGAAGSTTGIGLAMFEKNRLVGHQFEGEGWFESMPVRCLGGKLHINANAKEPLYVELKSCGYGDTIEGFSKGECIPVKGDSSMHSIRWKNNENLDKLKGRYIKIKVFGKNSTVYGGTYDGQ